MKRISDKRVWVVYVNVGNTPPEDVQKYIEKMKTDLNLETYSDLVCLYVPVRDGETRINVIQ